MLYLHETHQLVGRTEHDFEAAFRDELLPRLATGEHGDDARLLWYLNQAHGAGPAYTVVTLIGMRDGAAYQRLTERLLSGDLADWSKMVEPLRHRVEGKVLFPVHWSPLQDVDLATVPTTAQDHELTLYMVDTGWPSAALDDYIDFWGEEYFVPMSASPNSILDIEGCFQVAHGTGFRPEAILLQRVRSHVLLERLIVEPEVYDPDTWPGSYMHRGLELRDQWRSQLLRTASWSPLPVSP